MATDKTRIVLFDGDKDNLSCQNHVHRTFNYQRLAKLLEYDFMQDTVLECRNGSEVTELKANRAILAMASEHFFTEFTQRRNLSGDLSRVKAYGCKPHFVKTMVDFLYTGRISIGESDYRELYRAADLLRIDRVKQKCIEYLIRTVNDINWEQRLKFGTMHGAHALIEAVMKHVNKDFPAYLTSPQLDLLGIRELEKVLVVDARSSCAEELVFETVIRWFKGNSARLSCVSTLMEHLDFEAIDVKFLEKLVREEKILQTKEFFQYYAEHLTPVFRQEVAAKLEQPRENLNFTVKPDIDEDAASEIVLSPTDTDGRPASIVDMSIRDGESSGSGSPQSPPAKRRLLSAAVTAKNDGDKAVVSEKNKRSVARKSTAKPPRNLSLLLAIKSARVTTGEICLSDDESGFGNLTERVPCGRDPKNVETNNTVVRGDGRDEDDKARLRSSTKSDAKLEATKKRTLSPSTVKQAEEFGKGDGKSDPKGTENVDDQANNCKQSTEVPNSIKAAVNTVIDVNGAHEGAQSTSSKAKSRRISSANSSSSNENVTKSSDNQKDIVSPIKILIQGSSRRSRVYKRARRDSSSESDLSKDGGSEVSGIAYRHWKSSKTTPQILVYLRHDNESQTTQVMLTDLCMKKPKMLGKFKSLDINPSLIWDPNNKRLYALGGISAANPIVSTNVVMSISESALWKEDGKTQKWSKGPAMQNNRCLFTPLLLNGWIHVFGGAEDSVGNDAVNHAEKICLEGQVKGLKSSKTSWEDFDYLKRPRNSYGAAVLDGKLYVCGGYGSNEAEADKITILNTVECYDPLKDDWGVKATMIKHRHGCSTAVFHGKLYVMGGGGIKTHTAPEEDLEDMKTVEVYDHVEDSWTQLASMNRPRKNGSAAVLNDKIYVIGGDYSKGATLPPSSSVEVYNESTNTWTMFLEELDSSGNFTSMAIISKPVNVST